MSLWDVLSEIAWHCHDHPLFRVSELTMTPLRKCPSIHGADAGATLRLVACSKPYANSISRGSLHAVPVNPIPNGTGLALNPSGNGGVGALGTIPNGTTMIG